jgi:hypothetical protein
MRDILNDANLIKEIAQILGEKADKIEKEMKEQYFIFAGEML